MTRFLNSLMLKVLIVALSSSIGLVGLLGCSFNKPRHQAYTVTVRADESVNPDAQGAPSLIYLSFYELREEQKFLDAHFYDLDTSAETLLGGDLISVDVYLIEPGTTQEIVRRLSDGVHLIGVVAGFRELIQGSWKDVVVPPGVLKAGERRPFWWRRQQTKIEVRLTGSTLTVAEVVDEK